MTGGGIRLRAESTRFCGFRHWVRWIADIRYERLANMAGENKLENLMLHSVLAGAGQQEFLRLALSAPRQRAAVIC
jgi:hypothetical protein